VAGNSAQSRRSARVAAGGKNEFEDTTGFLKELVNFQLNQGVKPCEPCAVCQALNVHQKAKNASVDGFITSPASAPTACFIYGFSFFPPKKPDADT
jgi:hypothetical protein